MDEEASPYFENLAVRFRELVVSEKLYLQLHLSLDDVAARLEVSRYNLSHAVNNYLGKSFLTFIDALRIEEAVRLMGRPDGNKYRIADVASGAGFTDRQSFARICRRMTGLTPSELRLKLSTNK